MAQQIVCDVTKVALSRGENVGSMPVVVTLPHCDVELVVVARRRSDGNCPDLNLRAIRVMIERGEIRPAPELHQEEGSTGIDPLKEVAAAQARLRAVSGGA